jgi:F-type H+-transporting ATPase subunit epsilon
MIRLKVLLPTEVLVDEEVSKVVAEAYDGSFCLLPRHVDFLAALVPGIFSFSTPGGREEFLAVDEGILVKCGREVLVSTKNAVRGPNLGMLEKTIEKTFRAIDDREETAQMAFAKLEASFVRRFVELEAHG